MAWWGAVIHFPNFCQMHAKQRYSQVFFFTTVRREVNFMATFSAGWRRSVCFLNDMKLTVDLIDFFGSFTSSTLRFSGAQSYFSLQPWLSLWLFNFVSLQTFFPFALSLFLSPKGDGESRRNYFSSRANICRWNSSFTFNRQ